MRLSIKSGAMGLACLTILITLSTSCRVEPKMTKTNNDDNIQAIAQRHKPPNPTPAPSTTPSETTAQRHKPPAIIPQPVKMTAGQGEFVLTGNTAIYAPKELTEVAKYLAGLLAPATGYNPSVKESGDKTKTAPGNITLALAPDDTLGQEGYRLTVTPQAIEITAPTATGVFYGCQTLRQLLPVAIESKTVIPDMKWSVGSVQIEDYPRFAWRGSLLDSGRHIQSVEFIKKFIDTLAYHKMNRLHWHLTEDQGWRIEIKKYPELTEIGAWRIMPDGQKYGGYFTQEQIRQVVAYARSRHVLVVPEIELPGHSVAALAAYPQLSCRGVPVKVRVAWGVEDDVYCAGNEKVFEFLQDVLAETMSLFDSPWIHIGGDECPKVRWEKCPKCQARIKAEALADERQLQSYFIKRIEKFLNSHNRKLIGWDEILEGGLSPNATVQSWRGMDGGIEAARSGHDVIMSPTSHCYLDYSYQNISVERAYSFEPVPPALSADQAKHVLGLEGNLWTEHMPSEERVEEQAFPRLICLSEVAWSPAEKRSWDDFSDRLAVHLNRLDLLDVKYYIPTPLGLSDNNVFFDESTVQLKCPVAGAEVRYTLDGTEPTKQSPVYTAPITLTETTTVSAATFTKNTRSETIKVTFTKDTLLKPLEKESLSPGLAYEYYEGQPTTAKDFSALKKTNSGVIKTFGLPDESRNQDNFGVQITGFVKVPADGIYTFYTVSDDGSCLYIGNQLAVDNDGAHSEREMKGQKALAAGLHPITVRSFDSGGQEMLRVYFEGPDIKKQRISADILFH